MSRRRPGRLTLAATTMALVVLAGGDQPASAADPPWAWPLSPRPLVVTAFDPPADPWGSGHRGVDLQGRPGQAVLAVAPGTISFAGRIAGRGVVVVQHGEVRSTYEPVTPTVDVGDRVSAADRIATLTTAHSHCLPETCLHLGGKDGETYLDPMDFLGGGPVRLKPLSGDKDDGIPPPTDMPTGAGTPSSKESKDGGRKRSPWGLGLGVAGAAGLGLVLARRGPGQARG